MMWLFIFRCQSFFTSWKFLSVIGVNIYLMGLPWWLSSKEPNCQYRRHGLDPWVRKTHHRRKSQPTPVVLPWESHGRRSLVGYNPRGCRRIGNDLATKQQLLLDDFFFFFLFLMPWSLVSPLVHSWCSPQLFHSLALSEDKIWSPLLSYLWFCPLSWLCCCF